MLHGVATAETASCPLSTSVFPVTFLSLPRYEVHITDGGLGDLDDTVDGACILAVTACLGTAACTPGPVERVRISVRGRPTNATPREITGELVDALARVPGAEPGANAVQFPAGTAAETCGQSRVRLAASTRSDQNLTLRLTVRNGRSGTSSRLRLRCVPNDPSGGLVAPACFGGEWTRCPLDPGDPGVPAPPTTTSTTTPPFVDETSTTTSSTIADPDGTPTTSTSTTSSTAPLTAGGRIYYISPAGRDDGNGTSRFTAFRSFDRAISRLRPGDVLLLLDGTYTRGSTGLPRIQCGDNAVHGTEAQPITIRAENERRAFLSSDGHQAGLEMRNCRFWRIEGLRAASDDATNALQGGGFPFRLHNVHHVTLRRLLGSHNNRPQNTHVYAIEDSTYVLLEECEAYFFHRHAFSIWQSYGVTLRRCYANSMRYGMRGCCSDIDNRDYGDSAYTIYGSSQTTVENCISENFANGFHVHAINNSLDPSGHGGRHNRILGSISLDDEVGGLVSSRYVDGSYHNALGNVFRDFVAIDTTGIGIFLRGAADNVIENVTLYRSRSASGFEADGGDSSLGGTCGGANSEGCSFSASNVLSLDNAGWGIAASDQESWRVDHSNSDGSDADWNIDESISDAAGHVQQSRSVDPGPIGRGPGQCLAWIPEASPMKAAGRDGADIGANIVYRYVNGELTGTPLWDGETGAFPCGAVVAGINDGERSCRNLHERLNVNTNGCPLPLPTPP